MLTFHIYNNSDTEGNFKEPGDFYLLKTIVSFNSGKIKREKNRITTIISP